MSLSSAIFQHGRQQHSRTSHRPKQIICSWMSETGSRSALPVSCSVLTGIDFNNVIIDEICVHDVIDIMHGHGALCAALECAPQNVPIFGG
jgi:hypothetical protein